MVPLAKPRTSTKPGTHGVGRKAHFEEYLIVQQDKARVQMNVVFYRKKTRRGLQDVFRQYGSSIELEDVGLGKGDEKGLEAC